MRVDVADKDEVQAMVELAVDHWGRLDVLINNAWGGGELSRVEIKTDQLMNDAMHVGLYGPLWAMQAAFRSCAISSTAGSLTCARSTG